MLLKDTPIRRKLMTIILLITGTVLLVTCAAFFTYEFLTFRQTTIRNLSTLGKVIAANSTAALAFQNQDDAQEILTALKAEPHIVAASLYDRHGKLYSRYPADLPVANFPLTPEKDGYRFHDSHLSAFQPVVQGSKRLGTLYLRSNMDAMYERFRLYAVIVALVIAGSFLLAYVLSRSLQKQISQPILALAGTAKAISERRDYSVRATKLGADELGSLTDAFNQMLTQIEGQNQALRESEGRLRAVLNSALSAVIVMDGTGTITDWNSQAEKMFGWTRAEALGQLLAEKIIPPRYREGHRRGLQSFLATGKAHVLNRTIELSALRRDGSEFPVELSISPMRTGEAVTFCGFITDITERKQMEEVRERFVAIVQSSEDAIISKTLEGIITSWNPGAEKLFGYAADEVVGKSMLLIVPPDRLNEEADILNRINTGEGIDHFETVRVRKNGKQINVSETISPIKNNEGKVIGASKIARDITERKQAEEEIRRLNSDLERRVLERTTQLLQVQAILEAEIAERRQYALSLQQANRLKSEFLANMSHELRTPLNGIIGFAEFLVDGKPGQLNPKQREYLGDILNSGQHLLQLINDVLDLAKVEAGKMQLDVETFSLRAAIAEVCAVAKPSAQKKRLEVSIVVSPELDGVALDQHKFKQVLYNLLSNAIKFSNEGDRVEIFAAPDGFHQFKLCVTDSGIGIKPADINRLFREFEQLDAGTERHYEGTGLGLALTKKLVELHCGSISVESEFGKGSTFTAVFPLANGEQFQLTDRKNGTTS